MIRKLLISTAMTAVLLGVGTSCSDSPEGDSQSDPSTSTTTDLEGDVTDPNSLAGKIDTLIQDGIAQAQGGDLVTARTTFNNVLTLDPGNKFALFNLGVIEQTENRPQMAIKFYDKALASDPAYTPALYNKAILLEPDDLQAAVAIYEQILTIDPNASTTYLRLSFAYDTLGDAAKAEEMRQKAIELDPSLASETAPPEQ